MINVQVLDKSDASFNYAMSKFKKLCQQEGFIQELQDRRYYIKPSDKKRAIKRQYERNKSCK